jgi:ankyrin repeat protein
VSVVEILVKFGQDPNVANKVGSLCAVRRCEKKAEHLFVLYEMKFFQETGETPLHEACEYTKSDVARALLGLGADLHAKDNVRGRQLQALNHSRLR